MHWRSPRYPCTGPNFCVAGTVAFLVNGTRISASQLSADLLEHPWTVATSSGSSQDVLGNQSTKLPSCPSWLPGMPAGLPMDQQRSPRIGVPYGGGFNRDMTPSDAENGAEHGGSCDADSATVLVRGDMPIETYSWDEKEYNSQLEGVKRHKQGDTGITTAAMSANMHGHADLPTGLVRHASTGCDSTISCFNRTGWFP